MFLSKARAPAEAFGQGHPRVSDSPPRLGKSQCFLDPPSCCGGNPGEILVDGHVGWESPPGSRGCHSRDGRQAPPSQGRPHPAVPTHPFGPVPSLSIDDDGPRLVSVPPEHHAHGVPVQPVDVDGVGGLARPEQCPAVDVDAEVVGLPVWALALARRGQNEGLQNRGT